MTSIILIFVIIFFFVIFGSVGAYLIGNYQKAEEIQKYRDAFQDSNTLPVGFPSNEIIFPVDYKIIKAGTTDVKSGRRYSIAYITYESPNLLKQIYEIDMLKKGWKLDKSKTEDGNDVVYLSKDNSVFIITIFKSSEGDSRTAVHVMYL